MSLYMDILRRIITIIAIAMTSTVLLYALWLGFIC